MPDERIEFRRWIASLPVTKDAAEKLLMHLPDDAALDPELPCWISSASTVISMNKPKNCFGLPREPIDDGFLIIGSCPNGDPVTVNFRDPRLPVFYISHEAMYSQPLSEVIRKVSDALDDYDAALQDENSGIPLDYWHASKS